MEGYEYEGSSVGVGRRRRDGQQQRLAVLYEASDCYRLLADMLRLEPHRLMAFRGDGDYGHGQLEYLMLSFNIWAAYTGALARPGVLSMSDRLDGSPGQERAMVTALQMFLRGVERFMCLQEDRQPPRATRDVKLALQGLHSMADVPIRDCLKFDRDPCADIRCEEDYEALLEPHIARVIMNTFPRAQSTLCHRIAESIVLNRKRALESSPAAREIAMPPLTEIGEKLSRLRLSLEPNNAPWPFCAQKMRKLEMKDFQGLWHFPDPISWMNHMVSAHSAYWPSEIHMRAWWCDTNHGILNFYDEESFREHLEDPELHPRREPLREDQLAVLLARQRGASQRYDPYTCPLCEDVPRIVDNNRSCWTEERLQQQLYWHIEGHLMDLAVLSFPVLGGHVGGRQWEPAGLDADFIDQYQRQHLG
ncbi:hypothetical protein UVI_02044660 [Ustilaginoidea virens]|uniref:Uncharacterized protein n=1 Tax=Ustilaginoidea virens TaxID=1159556 RepID=A0A1B5L1K2_USTVR|nr:hypothetical protein UVI_02044660 [Ustilaginoidea virens]